MSTSLVVLVLMRARAGAESHVCEEITRQVERIRKEEAACMSILAHQKADDPSQFMLYEVWADYPAYAEFHDHRPYMQEYLTRMAQLIERGEVTLWHTVA